MNRLLLALALIGATVLAAEAQQAAPAKANANLPPCCQTDATGATAPAVNPEQVQKFLDATAKDRQELTAKYAAYDALMRQDTPDPNKAGELAKEIFTLRGKITAEAKAQGLGPLAMGPSGGGCPMMGQGRGGYGPGPGKGSCCPN